MVRPPIKMTQTHGRRRVRRRESGQEMSGSSEQQCCFKELRWQQLTLHLKVLQRPLSR